MIKQLNHTNTHKATINKKGSMIQKQQDANTHSNDFKKGLADPGGATADLIVRSISEVSSCLSGPRPWHIEIRHRVKKESIHNYFVRIWDSHIENSKIEIMETDRNCQLKSAPCQEIVFACSHPHPLESSHIYSRFDRVLLSSLRMLEPSCGPMLKSREITRNHETYQNSREITIITRNHDYHNIEITEK